MLIGLVLVALLVLPGCEGAGDGVSVSPSPSITTATPTEPNKGKAGRFDGLTINLELDETTVRSDGEVGSTLTVANNSGETIVDPRCLITSGRYALVPVDDPDAELWLQPVVDCGDVFKMPDGFTESYSGRTFPARTKFGEPLPPGDYIATLEIMGYSERLVQPIEVTE